jgi:hypothetical protein
MLHIGIDVRERGLGNRLLTRAALIGVAPVSERLARQEGSSKRRVETRREP